MHIKLAVVPGRPNRQPALRRQRGLAHGIVDQAHGAGQAGAHGGVDIVRADREAAFARGLHDQRDEIAGVAGLAQLLLQGDIGENARVKLLERPRRTVFWRGRRLGGTWIAQHVHLYILPQTARVAKVTQFGNAHHP